MAGNYTKGRTEKLRPHINHGECPLCFQQLPNADFMHTADFQLVVRNFHIARLTMQEANAFQALLSCKGVPIEVADLAERVQTTPGVAYIFIMNIRRKLQPLGIRVTCAGQAYQVQFER